jgi:uncharacterized protein
MNLKISPDLSLPRDLVTSTLVVYGGKGMGKTNLGSVIVEELFKAGLRWSYLDPLGVAWGLRHSADGRGAGVECVILGGAHGDIPIEPTGGVVVADLVVDETSNVIVDFSRKPNGEMWSIGEKTRFVTDYAMRVFQRQGGLVNNHRREPFFQILDESARYIPQVIPHGNPELAKCLAAWETLVEEGRNIGIGVGLLTQRSARMSKSVSELADSMFAFRIVGPNSIKAVTDWLGEHVKKERVNEYIEKLRSLPRGECLVVSPGWLEFEGVVHVRMRETFDSSATPKPGERVRRVTGKAARPDLAKYMERMKDTIERVKENDPLVLKARIRELEKKVGKPLTAAPAASKQVNADPDLIHKKVMEALWDQGATYRSQSKAFLKLLQKRLTSIESIQGDVARSIELELSHIDQFALADADLRKKVSGREIPKKGDSSQERKALPVTQGLASQRPITHPGPIEIDGDLTGPETKILTALAQLRSIGKNTPPRAMVAGWAGYSPNGGAFVNPLGALRTRGYLDYPAPGAVEISAKGMARVGDQSAPDEEVIRQRILDVCDGPERRILNVLLGHGNGEISRDELARLSGYEPAGGAFVNPLGALRTKGFLDYPRPKFVKPANWLFLD